jgi:hypothetical protein
MLSVLPDGSCFFRCVACYLNDDLIHANRSSCGRINNRTLREKETNFSRFLRFSVVNLIEVEKEKYSESIHYDAEFYKSIDERIEKMYNNNEYAGRLEMVVLSNMFKIRFNVYVINGESYNCVSSIGDESFRVCNLLLDEDHYELLLSGDDLLECNEECSDGSLSPQIDEAEYENYNLALSVIPEDEDKFMNETSIKKYINDKIFSLKRELSETINKDDKIERELYEQIAISSKISCELIELISKIKK